MAIEFFFFSFAYYCFSFLFSVLFDHFAQSPSSAHTHALTHAREPEAVSGLLPTIKYHGTTTWLRHSFFLRHWWGTELRRHVSRDNFHYHQCSLNSRDVSFPPHLCSCWGITSFTWNMMPASTYSHTRADV